MFSAVNVPQFPWVEVLAVTVHAHYENGLVIYRCYVVVIVVTVVSNVVSNVVSDVVVVIVDAAAVVVVVVALLFICHIIFSCG